VEYRLVSSPNKRLEVEFKRPAEGQVAMEMFIMGYVLGSGGDMYQK